MTRAAVPVWLVEDSEDDVWIFERAVRAINAPLTIRRFGTADAAWAARGEPLPAVLLLDLNVPGKTGLALLADLRKEPRWRGVPVVVLSASARDTDRDAALTAGAAAYLHKDAEFRVFVASLRDCLGRVGLLS